MKSTPKKELKNILILNDIRSSQNVGSLFRTADAVGIDKIYLVGISPTPLDRFGRDNSAFLKTSLGSEKSVTYEYKKTLLPILNKYKKNGYRIISIEQSENSIDYKKIKNTGKDIFILGNEVTGVPKKVLEKSDLVAEIKMKGIKESLNVSVAGGIVLFRILNV